MKGKKGFQKGHKINLGKQFAKGYKHTDEAKLKIGLASKLRKRKPLSDEHKLKLSLAHKGIKPSEETKKKMSSAHLGKKHTTESRRKMSDGKKGKIQNVSGSNNPNWKGGITPVNILIRSSSKMKQWRDLVFKRDDYVCQKCGQRGGKLNADHELPFSLFPGLRFEILNGQTLCVECHKNKTKIDRIIYA